MRKLLLCVGFAAVLAACGDNDLHGDDDPTPDASVTPDAMVEPDAMVCPARAPGQPGGACDANDDCDRDGFEGTCFVGQADAVVYPPEGYCILDDFITPNHCANDGECQTGEICVDFVDFTPYRVCMPACSCEGNTCPEHQACFDNLQGLTMDRPACVPGDAEAVDGEACAGFYECDTLSDCLADSIEFPGGECSRYGCTIGDDTTCNGGTCIVNDPPFTGTTCAVPCDGPEDCRTSEGYVCYDPDGAGTAVNYCRHPHVGDPCSTAADCGGGTWVCKQPGDGFMGGYCTQEGCDMPGQSADDCSPGSACYDPLIGLEMNYCVDRCPDAGIGTQSTCRTGYTCLDVLVDIPDSEQTGGCVKN